jgi:hypothetical protein
VDAAPARRIVYVVDASGPMASTLKFVKEELTRSVTRLDPQQEFQVIVFQQPVGSSVTTLSSFAVSGSTPTLTGASPEAKASLSRWLPQVRPGGRSDPLPALEAALALNPDLVFLLTRSINRSVGFDAAAYRQRVMDALDRLNPVTSWLDGSTPSRRTRIKTVQFLDDDPTGLMQEIARVHGDGDGAYRLLGRSEVAKQAREAADGQ